MRSACIDKGNFVINLEEIAAFDAMHINPVGANGYRADVGDFWDGANFITPNAVKDIKQTTRTQASVADIETNEQTPTVIREHILGIETSVLPDIQSRIDALKSKSK